MTSSFCSVICPRSSASLLSLLLAFCALGSETPLFGVTVISSIFRKEFNCFSANTWADSPTLIATTIEAQPIEMPMAHKPVTTLRRFN